MDKFNPLIEVEADLLFTPEVRAWSLEKYKLVGYYCDIFTSGMKNQWEQMVYIDLFAGAGHAKIGETGKIHLNSALIAMSIPNPFTKYILCELDPQRFEALSKRVARDFSHLNVELINGDSNEKIGEVIKAIPSFSTNNRLLPFCFVDPFSLNLNFATIQKLGHGRLMDFLILHALGMDANRNFKKYAADSNKTIDNYLGMPDWREIYDIEGAKYKGDFVRFISDTYQKRMMEMQYEEQPLNKWIKSNVKNLSLYYLAFYSKHTRGLDFFKKIELYSSAQQKLF